MTQQHKQPETTSHDNEEPAADAPTETVKDQELSGHSDELLDDIDSVLEANAEEFVEAYRQKGGQ